MTEIALIFATFMSTSTFMYSSGAYGSLERLRAINWVKNFGIFDCFLCLSFWFAIIFTFLFAAPYWLFFIAWGISYILDKLFTILSFIVIK